MQRVRFIFVLATIASVARAEPRTADGELARGKALYAAGDFAAATAAFRTAFELEPKSDYLFAWAQAVRKGGDCHAALALYRQLLAMTLTAEQTAATRQAMARCPIEPAPAPAIARPPREPAPLRRETRPPEDPWYLDWRADVLAGGGAIAIGAGAWLTVRSVGDERAARRATTYGEHGRLGDRARTFRIAGIAAIAVGTAGAALGVYRYATHRRDRPAVTAWLDGGGAGIALEVPWR